MERFRDADEQAMRGAEQISEMAANRGLVRADEPEHSSVRWGLTEQRPILWLHPVGDDDKGLEAGLAFVLTGLAEEDRAGLRGLLARFDATDAEAPLVAWDHVVDRWEELRDEVLDPYIDVWKRQG